MKIADDQIEHESWGLGLSETQQRDFGRRADARRHTDRSDPARDISGRSPRSVQAVNERREETCRVDRLFQNFDCDLSSMSVPCKEQIITFSRSYGKYIRVVLQEYVGDSGD